jgi:hypothetical protein
MSADTTTFIVGPYAKRAQIMGVPGDPFATPPIPAVPGVPIEGGWSEPIVSGNVPPLCAWGAWSDTLTAETVAAITADPDFALFSDIAAAKEAVGWIEPTVTP